MAATEPSSDDLLDALAEMTRRYDQVVNERDQAENERLRIENAYLKDTSPACAAEAVREKERAERKETEIVELQKSLARSSAAAMEAFADASRLREALEKIATVGPGRQHPDWRARMAREALTRPDSHDEFVSVYEALDG